MGFGAVVYVKPVGQHSFRPLHPGLVEAIVEIRVEQHLDQQTSFAIRFQEDYSEGCKGAVSHADLARRNSIAIIVPADREGQSKICLVVGQIEQSDLDIALGGPGSSYEIRGQDVRTVLDRKCEPRKSDEDSVSLFKGLVEELGKGLKVRTLQKARAYLTGHTFVGTALEQLTEITNNSNWHFWLTYEPKLELGKVNVVVNLLPSPKRKSDALGEPDAPLEQVAVIPENTPELVVLGTDSQCETVVSFRVEANYESVTRAATAGYDSGGNEAGAVESETPDDATNKGGTTASSADESEDDKNSVCIPNYGEPENQLPKVEAAVTRGHWFVKADTLTSVHMLDAVLQPHDMVKVVGAGCKGAGFYQVSDVTHVINPAEHWMQLSLRTNSLPKEPGNA